MILYRKKNIHKWAFWHRRSKFLFCITSAAIYAVFIFISLVGLKWLLYSSKSGIILSSAEYAILSFVILSFLSIAHWHENERKYKEWKRGKGKGKK